MQMKPQKEYEEEKIPVTPIRFWWFVVRGNKKYLITSLVALTFAQFATTSVPFIVRSIIDTATNASNGIGEVSDVWFWVIMHVLAMIVLFIGWRLSGFFGAALVTHTNASAYKTLFKYLTRHSYTYFADRFAGSLSSKITHASEGVQSLTEAFLWNYYNATLSIFLTLGYMYMTSPIIALIFFGLIVVLIPLNIKLAQHRRPYVVAYSHQATKARGYGVDAITNMAAVRQFVRGPHEDDRFSEQIDHMRSLNLKQWHMSEWTLLINNVLIVVFEAAVLFITVRLWILDTITTGDLVMIITLMIGIQGTLVFIGSIMNGFIRRYGEIEEGLTDILTSHEITDNERAQSITDIRGEIDWKHVRFDYGEMPVFEDFNLLIKPGERIGLVGESGAGKTTFISLLLHQHEVAGGTIAIDGNDISLITQDSLRENIAVVPQEPMLFHRSIRENIAYGKPNATDEEIFEVAKKAQAHEFITSLSKGYETLVGERGVKLSGGQKQRIAIARAMLKNAPILVLDEATSALDSESEVAIQKALHELMEGKTVIAIAHRLSTLREMDRIIVLEAGKIIEDGTHSKLSKAGGIYSRLWKHQAGGFLLE
ncbi:MAG: ABC transporter ATP-binding protein/permease [Candidatus Pacebacteria bacterium]|nr:ABC transporter ATP-binding protein/permease [Candidatus Paceibacterota bacterium]MCF7857591.1 ABC transporter ATP-binding protein/permease [Candidatus Paceibacterota bacterium]